MAETVAFLFSDLTGSTRLLAELGAETYGRVLSDYRRTVADAAEAEDGRVVDHEGDGIFLALPTAAGALRAAAAAQRRLAGTSWPAGADVAARMGIHVGEAHPHEHGYVGLDINRAARIGALAHGGQVLLSEAARLLAADALGTAIRLRDLGEHRLKGLDRPERIHQLLAPGLRDDFPTPRSHAAAPDANRSLAILPFEVVGGEDAEFLAIGLHNDLLTELSKIPELTVISRTSVLGYRGTDEPIPRIARELNVGTVVEGAVQSAGRRVRLTVQLIDGIEDAHRWAESYDRLLTTENLFEIQSELTRQIAGSLHNELVAPQETTAEGPPTGDLDAYRLAAWGRQQFDLKTEEGFLRAIELFEEAVDLDPGYTDAWVGLADALALMEDYGYGDSEELLRRAQDAVDRALALDADSAGAHASLGLIHNTHQDGPASIRELERAISLRPGYADAHNWHSWVSLLIGRAREGLDSAARGVELDPLSPEPILNLSLSYTATGQPADGALEARRAAELSPFTSAHFCEGIARYELGDHDGARKVLEPLAVRAAGTLTVPWAGHGPDATLATSLVGLGATDEARAVLATIDADTDPFAAGLVLVALDEVERAAEVFGAVSEMSPWPCLAIHHYYGDVWRRIEDTDTHRDLLDAAYRSWNLDPPDRP